LDLFADQADSPERSRPHGLQTMAEDTRGGARDGASLDLAPAHRRGR
jgi:hypothetical protein